MSLVVVGGGIVGLAIAYYVSLTDPSRKIFILDSEKELFLSASGYSGGFIVRDWFSHTVLPLAELSFRLHRDLADAQNGRKQWGYTPSIGYSLVMEDNSTGQKVRGEDWLLHGTSRAEVARKYASLAKPEPESKSQQRVDRDSLLRPDGSPLWANIPTGGVLEKISSPSGCAQVEPRQLCEWLLQRCRDRGVELHLSTKITGLSHDSAGNVVGVRVEKRAADGVKTRRALIHCKDVVISAGCWTPRVFETLTGKKMSIGITPLPGYSITVRSPRYSRPILEVDEAGNEAETSHSIFCPPGRNWQYSPEAMARQTREGKPEVYVAGLNNESHRLPELAGQSKQLMEKFLRDDLKRTAVTLVGKLEGLSQSPVDDLEIVREGLCFRPVSESGKPIISRVEDIVTKGGGGLYVASGHGPWGITLSLATGFVMAEVLQGKNPSVSLDEFRLQPQTSAHLQARL
ncbi:FAD dependent oxidoreductase [Exophiala viscosa]|uniref:FAD dependent oxidoreductase n=1 Tax=Exophiala viscosa TaxID=2486360 RepID=A0AAN6I9M3_9EURO|nr:FAD dependent oxidoreductase [Exophiala viscosa]KAI1620706.1 FAD dependent oxidoreductase [Exophiala viscosa]